MTWDSITRGWAWQSALVAAYFFQRYFVYSVLHVWPHHELDGYAPFAAAALAIGLTFACRGGARLDFALQYAVRFAWCAILISSMLFPLTRLRRHRIAVAPPASAAIVVLLQRPG